MSEQDRDPTMNFRSDNEAPVAAPIMAALAAANQGTAHAYGDDDWSQRLDGLFSELFEHPAWVFPVATGTVANALSVAQICPPYGALLCHENAHVNVDECAAPEFHSGGAKLVPLAGAHGRISLETLQSAIDRLGWHGDHSPVPSGLSFAQASESGTLYPLDQVRALSACAHDHGLRVHLDGARLANALVGLGASAADATWRAGIDIVSFGATKNGALAGEAVVVFSRDLAEGLSRRRMRAGHLMSKMRFFAAQLEAYIADGLWLDLARTANAAAARLAAGLERIAGVALLHPVEANQIFTVLPPALSVHLRGLGFAFHDWPGQVGAVRLVCSHATATADVEAMIAAAQEIAG